MAIIAIVILILIIGLSIFMSIIGNKKPIEADKFIEITTELGYNTSKVTTTSNVIDVYSAKKEEYEIEFYVTSSVLAEKNFDRIKREYEREKQSSSLESIVSVENYSKYTLTTNGYHMIVTKIDTTVMFAKVPSQYKNEVSKIFDKLGY